MTAAPTRSSVCTAPSYRSFCRATALVLRPLLLRSRERMCHGPSGIPGGQEARMAETGRIYQRGAIFFIAYTHNGHEFRESARTRDIDQATRLLARRLAECG